MADNKFEKGAERTGKAVAGGVKKGVGAVAGFGKGVANRVDMSCDQCSKTMKPGGNVTRKIGGKEYQFCSESCATKFKVGKAKQGGFCQVVLAHFRLVCQN